MPSLGLLLGTMLLRTKGSLERELEYPRSLLKAQSSLVVVNAAFDLSRHQLTLLNKENEVGCPENAANQIKKISVLVARGVTQALSLRTRDSGRVQFSETNTKLGKWVARVLGGISVALTSVGM